MSKIRVEFLDRVGVPFHVEAECVCSLMDKMLAAFRGQPQPEPHRVTIHNKPVTLSVFHDMCDNARGTESLLEEAETWDRWGRTKHEPAKVVGTLQISVKNYLNPKKFEFPDYGDA